MSPLVHDLADPARSGISSVAAAELPLLEAAARDSGLQALRIDLRGCRDKTGLLKRLARALRAPAGQGGNWDALADQLRDLGWLPETRGYVLLFTHAAALRTSEPASFTTLLAILTDAADHWRTRGIPFRAMFTLPDAALRMGDDTAEPRQHSRMDEPNATTALRAATPADVPALVDLVTRSYRGDASRVGWTTEADLLDGERIDPDVLRADIARPYSRVLIAERDGTPVACAHVCRDGDAGYFGMFAVSPGLQGAGLGSHVLDACERIAATEWQLPTMRMTVIEQRAELIAYYQRRGYRRTGIFKPFPYGDPRFGLPKRDDLRFEVLEKSLQPEAAA